MVNLSSYILKVKNFAESAFQSQKKLRKKRVNLDIKTLGQKCINYYKSPKYVAEKVSLKPRTCSLDIYGISLQDFDTYLKLLLCVTKFHRANLLVFAFSDYNFAEYSNNLQSPDFQDFRF